MGIRFGRSRAKTDDSNTSTKGQSAVLLIVALVFGLFGIIFTVVIFGEVKQTYQRYSWNEVECAILAAEIQVDPPNDSPFELRAKYMLKKGNPNHPKLHSERFEDYTKAYRRLLQYQANRTVTCYQNPASTADYVLERGSLWLALLLILPLIFVAISLLVIVSFLRKRQASVPGHVESISRSAPRHFGLSSSRIPVFVFGIFLLVGLGLGYPLAYQPLKLIYEAQSWVPTEAVVEFSRVRSHDSDDGTTYSVDVFYSYEFEGKRYSSNRYLFFGGSSSGYAGKSRVVKQYPRGRRFTCFVDPRDPLEAVIVKDLTWHALLALIPSVFVLVGFFGIMFSLRKKRTPELSSGAFIDQTVPDWMPSAGPGTELLPNGEVKLTPVAGPLSKVIGTLVFVLFWNGIISIFIYSAFNEGQTDWFTLLFMTPFVLIGLASVGFFFYFLLALRNPRPSLILPRLEYKPGESFQIRLKFSGSVSSVTSIELKLQGIEEATYRRGTDTVTDTEVFYDRELYRGAAASSFGEQSIDVTLPAKAVPSFEAPNNKIKWKIKLHADIPNWPDVSEEFALRVSSGGLQDAED